MKKIIFGFILIGTFALTSCKKDRVCECTTGGTGQKITLTDASKRQAKDVCLSYSEDNGNGGTTKYECELK